MRDRSLSNYLWCKGSDHNFTMFLISTPLGEGVSSLEDRKISIKLEVGEGGPRYLDEFKLKTHCGIVIRSLRLAENMKALKHACTCTS